MNKLISNPTECGYRKSIFTRLGIPFGMECTHKNKPCVTNTESLKGIVSCCNWDKEFPVNCPLHDGIPTTKSIEELIQLAKQDFRKIKSSPLKCIKHNHTYYKNGKRVYPKRNRKNCIHHKLANDTLGRCLDSFRNGYLCVGVNCGCFKTK